MKVKFPINSQFVNLQFKKFIDNCRRRATAALATARSLIIGHSPAKRGFTLVEILVAMAIMAIVGGIGFGVYVNSQKKGRDAERKSDLAQLRNALELYHNDKGQYPLGENCKIKGCGSIGGASEQTCEWGQGSLTDGKTVYLKPVPKDPRSDFSYCYESDGTSYRIFAYLENPGSPVVSDLTQSCGSNTCNFGLASANSDLAGTIVPTTLTPTPGLAASATPTPMPTPLPTATPIPTPAFGPDQVAGLAMWLNADAISGISDGGNVAVWSDSSGNRNGASQTSFGAQPVYKANAFGSKPALRFSGSQFMTAGGDLLTPGGSWTVFAVAKTSQAASVGYWDGIFLSTSRLDYSSGAVSFLYFRVANFGCCFEFAIDAGFIRTVRYGAANLSSHLHAVVKNGNTFNLYLDGVAGGTRTYADSEMHTSAGPVLGRASVYACWSPDPCGVKWYYYQGDIAEVLIYDRAVSDTDRQKVEGYLKGKYGL